MLTYCVGNHWHPLVSDLLTLGLRMDDMFTEKMTLAEMVSWCMSPPPTSSLRTALDRGWSKTDHLIANLTEQAAGLSELKDTYDRPKEDTKRAPGGLFPADAYDWDDFSRMEAERYRLAEERRQK